MNRRVLFVDDDPQILRAYEIRLSRRFDFVTAMGAGKALELLEAGEPFAVVLSDVRMPGMDGVSLLARVREAWPDTVRMLLTGNADLESAIQAVNRGQVFRFLTKPCDRDLLASALEEGVEMYRLVTSEKVLLRQTLGGCVSVLTDMLSLVHPLAFGRSARMKRYVRHLAAKGLVADTWRLELAAMLSQLGCVSMSPETLEAYYADSDLSDADREMLSQHPRIASDLLSRIPYFEGVADMIALQDDSLDEADDEPIAYGARVLQTLTRFDHRILHGMSPEEAARDLRRKGNLCDPRIAQALCDFQMHPKDAVDRFVQVEELDVQMILAQDVRARNGRLLVTRGMQVTVPLRMHLLRWNRKVGLRQPIRVFVPAEFAASAPR